MRTIYIILAILLSRLPVSAGTTSVNTGPSADSRVRTLTLEGLSLAYNLEFEEALERFNTAIAMDPLQPRPWLGKASIRFWYYLLGRQETEFEAFRGIADSTIDVATAYLDNRGEDADVMVCLGMIYGYLSFAEARSKDYFAAAWHGKKSYDYFRSAVELDSTTYDAYLGLGVYHYFSAFLPRTLRWIVSILGVESNSDLGVRQVRVAEAKGVYSRYEAKYYLAQFLPWYNGDFQSSETMLTELLQEFPSNGIFAFTLAVWQVRRNSIESALRLLEPVVAEQSTQLPGVKRYALYKLAECYYRLEDHALAVQMYRRFLSGNNEDMYRATALYRLGISLERSRQREEALKYYRRAAEEDHSFGDDLYSARHARLRIEQPLSPADTLLLHAQNVFKCGTYNEAESLYTMLRTTYGISTDLRAEATYGLGEALLEKKLYAEALDHFRDASTIRVDRETWIAPWSHYQIARCYQQLGQPARALQELEQVSQYDDYDFESWLAFRTERELRKYDKK